MHEERIGIIDIGSNSIRLVIYERTPLGAYHVIDGFKEAGRLSGQVDEQGRLREAAVERLVEVLHHFKLICSHHRTVRIRTVATAAIRGAANSSAVLDRLCEATGLAVELLSGEEEAAYGFLGMVNTIDIRDGFLVDIGGGSSELTLFRDRKLVRSVSLPFGCVNMAKRCAQGGTLDDRGLQQLEAAVREAIDGEPWIGSAPGLPLVGIGGTARALAKIHQAYTKYPLPQTHNYDMLAADTDALFAVLRDAPAEKRKKMPGLSKDRVDLIVPGIAILRAFREACRASRYVICGAGLRDGIFFDSLPGRSEVDHVLDYSISSLVRLYPGAPLAHLEHVTRLSGELFGKLRQEHPFPPEAATWLRTASMLFRIGGSIDYYSYAKHTFYLMTNAHLNGLTHRGILIAAAIASYKNRSGVRQLHAEYKPLLSESDIETICRLGTLLQLAIALDRSESQSAAGIAAEIGGGKLLLRPHRADSPLAIERKEIEALSADFKKIWGFAPVLA